MCVLIWCRTKDGTASCRVVFGVAVVVGLMVDLVAVVAVVVVVVVLMVVVA